MRELTVTARAPSNIALIKYMGKDDAGANVPANGSLSLTLDSLRTVAEVRVLRGPPVSRWVAELPAAARGLDGARVPPLSEAAAARACRHAERVRAQAPDLLARHGVRARSGLEDVALELRTANTFPAAAGVASSASSFAALTLAASAALAEDLDAFQRAYANRPAFRQELAALSRQGSGSSCRSFDGPWVRWDQDGASALRAGNRMPAMTSLVLLVAQGPKAVASSDAHRLVRTSPLWHGRVERVAARLGLACAALARGDLRELARIAWTEMWEMHSLFHTCAEPFTYWEPASLEALRWFAPHIGAGEAPPIVTMDAGANVHCLVPSADADAWAARLREAFPARGLLEDRQGPGASLVDAR